MAYQFLATGDDERRVHFATSSTGHLLSEEGYSHGSHSPASSVSSFTSSSAPPRSAFNRRSSGYSVVNSNTPYDSAGRKMGGTMVAGTGLGNKFALPANPQRLGSFAYEGRRQEADDALHNPSAHDDDLNLFSARGLANVGCLLVLCAAILGLFAGYPIFTYFNERNHPAGSANTLANDSGMITSMHGLWSLIDPDTPEDAKKKKAWNGGDDMELIFSDEFNQDGRTFAPGDDKYWTAVDLHYWQTNNLEWYDPSAITTKDGKLVITLSEATPELNHGMNYKGGMMTTWNQFCFTGGMVEASVTLPGANDVVGLWPAIWSMGNLGRAGYGASLEGLWPYSYDSCDVGTAPNQTVNGQPVAATENGDPSVNGILSYLQGQRLSRCTCGGESHPGPKHSDGTYVGRAAPEIDMFEATVEASVGSTDSDALAGLVSQSAQWAPFNQGYIWKNTSDNLKIYDTSISEQNPYIGGKTQQATSALTNTNQDCYELEGGCSSVYGFEYVPGFDNAYITWVTDNKASWTINAAGVGADDSVGISARPVPQEPMYLIMNLGISENFGTPDLTNLKFPAHMSVDWIRVYQRSSDRNVGCNPKDFPTEPYIEKYQEAYSNPNLTTWVDDYKQSWPKNSFLGEC
ncbi:unnamed protein product [Peniophora sp. CBMAI 1063]|nr:unnamed protein product [Peniophora sp. CBMAI 1063]